MRGSLSPPISWIYDCGTISKDNFLEEALRDFDCLKNNVGSDIINIAVISHLDKDHISGFVRLLQNSRVENILIPYVPLWRRLLIAVEQGVAPGSPQFEFFFDPVAYLYSIEGSAIGQILLVPPAGPEDNPPELPPEVPRGPIDEGFSTDWDETIPVDADGDPVTEAKAQGQARFLRRGGRIHSWLWEFVPYNDAEMLPNATVAFKSELAPLLNDFRSDAEKRAPVLKSIKSLYDKHFGKTAEKRNLISLFLYSGPAHSKHSLAGIQASQRVARKHIAKRYGQMYSGDGMLNSNIRFDRFKKFYSVINRIFTSGLFQVPHHGSCKSWLGGIAAHLKPVVSIVSSDPHGRFKHPE